MDQQLEVEVFEDDAGIRQLSITAAAIHDATSSSSGSFRFVVAIVALVAGVFFIGVVAAETGALDVILLLSLGGPLVTNVVFATRYNTVWVAGLVERGFKPTGALGRRLFAAPRASAFATLRPQMWVPTVLASASGVTPVPTNSKAGRILRPRSRILPPVRQPRQALEE